MPKAKIRTPCCAPLEGATCRELHSQDVLEAGDVCDLDNAVEGEQSGVSSATVKMKLNTFCTSPKLKDKLQKMVIDMNQLLGEAYAFANLHVLRLLQAKDMEVESLPKLDRNFYYRCLVAVSINNARKTTLGDEVKDTLSVFDALRDPSIVKVSSIDQVQVLADMSISMATMAQNHLWMNVQSRLTRFLRWSEPTIKTTSLRKRIVDALLYKPKKNANELFPAQNDSENAALQIVIRLRGLLALPSSAQYANRAHLLLPLYHHILEATEQRKASASTEAQDKNKGKDKGKSKRYRTFTLLPLKNGYTISHIQFSSMALLGYLKALGLEKFAHDGRNEDAGALLKKHFHVNMVETKNRSFGNRISTDGVAVSVLMSKKTALICPSTNECHCPDKLKALHARSQLNKKDPQYVRIVAVDPGFTDVVSIADQQNVTASYSSARYYETALYNLSRRRIGRWNEETEDITKTITNPQTASFDTFKRFCETYLAALPVLLDHRRTKGYRNMRFLRYIRKKKAINDICDMVTGSEREKEVVIGFGDWNGGKGTPIKRRCAGPLQEIKFALANKHNVTMLSIDEAYSSQKCNKCQNQLINMKALTTTKRRAFGTSEVNVVVEVKKVHKILHCRSSQVGRPSTHCGKTWFAPP